MDKSLDLPKSYKLTRKDPNQQELEWLFKILGSMKISRVLEIGAGATTYAIHKATNPEYYLAVEESEDSIKFVQDNFKDIHVINNWEFDSHGPFDLVFVDSSAGAGGGLHRDRAILTAEPFMKDDCIVIIHDYNVKMGKGARAFLESNGYELIAFSNAHKGTGIFRRPQEQKIVSDFITDYSNLTVVTACDRNHIGRLEISLPTWVELKKLTCPIMVFAHEIDKDGKYKDKHGNEKQTSITKYDNVEIIPWDIEGVESQRERMLSAFLFGAAKHVKTSHYLKLDSDTIATDDQLFIQESFFDYDMVGQPWGYSKPGSMVPRIDYWLDGLSRLEVVKDFKGPERRYLFDGDDTRPDKQKYRSRRVISWCRLTKMDLIKEIVNWLIYGRMPVPSEDTLVWRVCERLNKRWLRYNFKDRGFTHTKRNMESIADEGLRSVAQSAPQ